MQHVVNTAHEFMTSGNGSYSRLADHLNKCAPRADGSRWTKDSAYYLCRTHGIRSNRRCKSQPSAGETQRTNTRKAIIAATLDALSASSRTIEGIAPVHLKEIVMLSGVPLCNVRNNWPELEDEFNTLAGL
ncbi:hypothetical protein D9M69_496000 [compost metagenome]